MNGQVITINRSKWKNRLTALALAVMLTLAAFVVGRAAYADVSYGGALNCDSNAVMYCGARSGAELVSKYTNGDGHNTATSIQAIYSYFGISSTAVQAIPTSAVMGSVTSSGDVYVGSNKVATSAITGGRQNMPGSTAVTAGGTTFYSRPPSVSFASSSLPAYVVMNSSNQFQFAVIASCGNAVKATPVAPPAPAPKPAPTPPATTPNYTIQKMVAAHGSSNFGSEMQVSPNTDVDFKVVVSSTGSADVTNLVVSDTLPSDLTYVSTPQDTLARDGQMLSSTQATAFFGGGLTVGTLAHGTTTTFTFEALAGANQNNDNCNPETLPNVAHTTATNLPAESATATVSIVCTPKATPAVVTKVTTPPAAPTVLPNTGAAGVVGLFTGAAVAGTVGYHWLLRRRLSR